MNHDPSPATSETHGWRVQERPPLLICRQDFTSYAMTRLFLDQLAAWSEESGVYPDLSFGTSYVNITVSLKNARPSEEEWGVTQAIDAIARQARK